MTLKGKTMAAWARLPLVFLCAACVLTLAAALVPEALAEDSYTVTIPADLTIGEGGTGSMDITGSLNANHRLTVEASGGGSLTGPANDAVAYTLVGGTFTVSAHTDAAAINQRVTATVTGTPRYEGVYTDTVTFTLSCAATHTLTLDTRGGSLPEDTEASIELETGEQHTLPTPTRDGYHFDGWFTQATGGTSMDAVTMADADTTVYAHWTAYVLTINYYSGYANTWNSYSHNYNPSTGTNAWSLDPTQDMKLPDVEIASYDGSYPHGDYGILDVNRLVKNGYESGYFWRVYLTSTGEFVGNVSDGNRFHADGKTPFKDATGKDAASWLGVLDLLKTQDVSVDLHPVFIATAQATDLSMTDADAPVSTDVPEMPADLNAGTSSASDGETAADSIISEDASAAPSDETAPTPAPLPEEPTDTSSDNDVASGSDDAAESPVDDDTTEPDALADASSDISANAPEASTPESEAAAPIPEAVPENDQPRAVADASQPESNR